MEQLDQLNNAEPLDAESDLIIRMQAVSKVRKGNKKEKKSLSPSKGISKRQSRRAKRDGGLQVSARKAAAGSGDMETR